MSTEYHKIHTLFKRDMSTKKRKIIFGDWSRPEIGYLANNQWTFTEKVDGKNIRIIYTDGEIYIEGRSNTPDIPSKLLTALQELFLPKLSAFKEQFPKGVVLYGEGYGKGINKIGELYLNDNSFVLFDAKINGQFLSRESLLEIAVQFALDIVPVIHTGTLYDGIGMCKTGLKSRWGDFEAEGLVAVPTVPLFSRDGSRIITKIKCKDFK